MSVLAPAGLGYANAHRARRRGVLPLPAGARRVDVGQPLAAARPRSTHPDNYTGIVLVAGAVWFTLKDAVVVAAVLFSVAGPARPAGRRPAAYGVLPARRRRLRHRVAAVPRHAQQRDRPGQPAADPPRRAAAPGLLGQRQPGHRARLDGNAYRATAAQPQCASSSRWTTPPDAESAPRTPPCEQPQTRHENRNDKEGESVMPRSQTGKGRARPPFRRGLTRQNQHVTPAPTSSQASPHPPEHKPKSDMPPPT